VRAIDVERQRRVHPRVEQRRRVRDVVTTRQHRHAGARAQGPFQHAIGEAAARVARHDQIVSGHRDGLEIAGHERDAIFQARPCRDERRVQTHRRRRQCHVHDHGGRRRVIE